MEESGDIFRWRTRKTGEKEEKSSFGETSRGDVCRKQERTTRNLNDLKRALDAPKTIRSC